MKNKNFWESLQLGGSFVLLVIVAIFLVMELYKRFSNSPKKTSQVVEAHDNFDNPDFLAGDCFLVSNPGDKIHPHYLKIVEKDQIKKKYQVIETIGNGQPSKEVVVYVNYYDEMKSFEKYRSSCPKFLIK